jgi:Na+/H+ antiporter NhaD/arsenite permease-like protein
MLTIILLLLVLAGFAGMTIKKVPQEVALSLVALGALALAGAPDDAGVLQNAFKELSHVAVLFTAVAVPAHLLMRSNALRFAGALVGGGVGTVSQKTGMPAYVLVPATLMFMVWLVAALAHNTTSILTMVPVVIAVCASYKLPVRPSLAGALIASNLGGFSTRWGDTPNITEAAVFGLKHSDFFREIMPLNLICLMAVTIVVTLWSRYSTVKGARLHGIEITLARKGFSHDRRTFEVDRRLLLVGLTGLGVAIVGPMLFPAHELTLSALSILLCVIAERPGRRQHTLMALGPETYVTFAAIFVLARTLTESHIGVGAKLQEYLMHSGSSALSIVLISYVGTLLTEAASWASAASHIVYMASPTHAAAWALGAGICAGSSSLTTAASAGILLVRETKHLGPNEAVNFGTYLCFGLIASFLMLAYYVSIFTIWH